MTLPGKPDMEPAAPAATRPAPGWYRVSDGDEKGAIYLESQSDGTVYEWERRTCPRSPSAISVPS